MIVFKTVTMEWGGTATEDNCGTCDADPSNDCVQDCNGDWGGDAVADNYGTLRQRCYQRLHTRLQWGLGWRCDRRQLLACDNDATNDCVQDCSGEWGGTATVDNCNVCDSDSTNDNTTCVQDCHGDWDGTAATDFLRQLYRWQHGADSLCDTMRKTVS